MNTATTQPNDLIQRPDGSYVSLAEVEPRHALAHDLVMRNFAVAETVNEEMAELKKNALSEMRAYREMMLTDYDTKVGGKEGNLSLPSLCGRYLMKLTVSKHVTFGPELEAAKALIDRFFEQELNKGGSVAIREVVEKVFKVNSKGRLDTYGILGLREHRFDDPLWQRAMDAIDDAICRDSSTTYLNFYYVDPTQKPRVETLLPLQLSKV